MQTNCITLFGQGISQCKNEVISIVKQGSQFVNSAQELSICINLKDSILKKYSSFKALLPVCNLYLVRQDHIFSSTDKNFYL